VSQDDKLDEKALEAAVTALEDYRYMNLGRNRPYVVEYARTAITAYLSAMPQRVSPELIAQLNKLATYLTEQGEYEAVDLIDTVVARVSGAALEHQQKETK